MSGTDIEDVDVELHGVAPVEELLTSSEAARMLRVSPKTIHRWAKAGHLHHIMTIGGHIRIFRTAVERILREGRV